jgi:hypothetical protein
MCKIFIPESSLILELEPSSFWRLIKTVEEKLVFQAEDNTFYYFSNSDVVFYAKSGNEAGNGLLPRHLSPNSFKSGFNGMGSWAQHCKNPSVQPAAPL